MTVPEFDREHMAGNHLIVACGDVHVITAHFRQGSVLARVGDAVALGQKLAEVGNSGGSDEPHLHIHVQTPGTHQAPMSGEPLPARFDGRFLVRGERFVSSSAAPGVAPYPQQAYAVSLKGCTVFRPDTARAAILDDARCSGCV
jgi:hypothetical protein